MTPRLICKSWRQLQCKILQIISETEDKTMTKAEVLLMTYFHTGSGIAKNVWVGLFLEH